MPCNCDHLKATNFEREISKVYCCLDELNGITVESSWRRGYHPKVYNKSLSRERGNALTAELCERLQSEDVTKYSLELQMWWRDHQAADKSRLEREIAEARKESEKQEALAKLTPYERKLLGYADDMLPSDKS